MENTMIDNLQMRPKQHLYLKIGLIIFALFFGLISAFLFVKGPSIIKGMAQATLAKNLAPLGIKHVEIDKVNVGLGRFYFRGIRSSSSSSEPSLNIQEMDVALSIFLKVKAIDVVGASLEMKENNSVSYSHDLIKEKVARFGKLINQMKQIKIPTFAMRDCLLIVPSSQGPLKLKVHATTEMTVAQNQILTIDWGEYGDKSFYGQFIVDSGKKGITLDLHMANIDLQTPTFQIKAPEISFWGTTAHEVDENYKFDGLAKIDQLMLQKFGTLKQPLEVNVEGDGSPDNMVLDELSIVTTSDGKSIIELEGSYKPSQLAGQIILTAQISQLSNLWDFKQLVSPQGTGTISGKLNLTSEINWEKGDIKTSALALNLKEGKLIRNGLVVEGANTQIVFDSLKPLRTKGEQTASASKITLSGVDLKNVSLKGAYDADGLFQIKTFTAETLHGSLTAHRFQRIEVNSKQAYQFETDFKNIELAEILKLTDLNSISGRAKLSGNASMRYSADEGFDIQQGELHSVSSSGLLQYKPGTSKEEQDLLGQKDVNIAFQVLDNLNFTVFNVRLSQDAKNPSEMQGVVKILGSNPNVLNGYPFEFNIVTSGKLKDLVLNTLKHMRSPADMGEINKAITATKEAKALQKVKELEEGIIPEVAKTTEDLKTPKVVQKASSDKTAKKAQIIKGKKAVKSFKKLKKAKANRNMKQETRKLNNG
jgi:hypothetical protein